MDVLQAEPWQIAEAFEPEQESAQETSGPDEVPGRSYIRHRRYAPTRGIEWLSEGKLFTQVNWIRLENLRRLWLASSVADAVGRSFEPFRDLLKLEEDWKGPGSEPVTSAAWQAATDTMRNLAVAISVPATFEKLPLRLVPLDSGGLHVIVSAGKWEFTFAVDPEGSGDQEFLGEDGPGIVQGNLGNRRQFEDAANFLRVRLQ